MNLITILCSLKREDIIKLVKFFVYLFIGLLTLISTISSFGLALELEKIPMNERGYAVFFVFFLALPQFFYTIYTIKWIIKKIFKKK